LNRLFYTIAFLLLTFPAVNGQTIEKEKFVQVSGIITDESDRPVAGTAVISKKLKRGTISERSGIYSITSTPIIPISYEERHCKIDITLEIDTIPIAEITILPWKSYNDFLKDMTKERPVDPIIENMNDNLASIYVAMSNQTGLKVSPEAGYRYAMEQNFSAMATRNQFPVNNLLNPFAWAKFVNGVKHGLFKNQKFNKPVKAKVRKKSKKSVSR
jgi:hypothetical protein